MEIAMDYSNVSFPRPPDLFERICRNVNTPTDSSLRHRILHHPHLWRIESAAEMNAVADLLCDLCALIVKDKIDADETGQLGISEAIAEISDDFIGGAIQAICPGSIVWH